jgi:hypothetical protein
MKKEKEAQKPKKTLVELAVQPTLLLHWLSVA